MQMEVFMLITVDKRGSINLPAALRSELGLVKGSYFDLVVEEGGTIRLQPVSMYPCIRLNEKGLNKLKEARQSGRGTLPEWLVQDVKDAGTDTQQKIS